jgi:hypothetical protein
MPSLNVWRMRSNAKGRELLVMMHNEANKKPKTVAMCRTNMLTKLREQHKWIENDAIRLKVLKREERLIKSACMRLVKLGHLVSKQSKGTRMYALPHNKEYL